jgi:hypothetical protein
MKRLSIADEFHQLTLVQLLIQYWIQYGNFANTIQFAKALKTENENQPSSEQKIDVDLTKFEETEGMEFCEIETVFYVAIVQ